MKIKLPNNWLELNKPDKKEIIAKLINEGIHSKNDIDRAIHYVLPDGWSEYKKSMYIHRLVKSVYHTIGKDPLKGTESKKSHGWKILSEHTMEEIMLQYENGEIRSERINNLIKLGNKCVSCGLEGDHFKITVDGNGGEHLDMYSSDGTMMTIDHIIPVSKGGLKKCISNMQTMCKVCNEIKGDKIL